ncbi:2'-deoxycytidine 5'-triphosphate deaminase domain-containing protein [Lichenifustis flavocetrariae]|uniref:2'-deoxycytidine 5'-triphosphate deaminase n=1 Tax=Lichenifustis flavocetrariae TaxID=2949735 RepID=A0AA42CKF7_9HYPH|nr:2'-deoxycytidine 5'-triphosphate deaminase [Lichenifustis flavocetrariae]MCW6510533.1 2'-deoxycytidine 5'-triphosphate deaminase [Lichenifustis flavocetrariae]
MMTFRIWPSQRIRQAVETGIIIPAMPLAPDQIQPASMDLRIADRAYRVPASFLPGPHRTVRERLTSLSTHVLDLTQPRVLERNCVHIIPLLEEIRLGPTTSARANPKSSSGRLDIFVRLITDYGTAFDDIPEGYQGPLFAEVVPRSFPVIVGRGTTLNQIRFRERGAGPAEAKRTSAVTINLQPTSPDRIIGYRARRAAGLVDLAAVGAHRRGDFWEPLTIEADRGDLVLVPDEFYILASFEDVRVEAGEAAEMIAYDTSVGEARVHYAGFLDPGFGLPEAGGTGSKVVLEVRSHDVPFLLEHGQHVGTLEYEPMLERPDQLYGQGIRSNYQGQGLKLSKQFR